MIKIRANNDKGRADTVVAFPTAKQATLSITLSERLKTTIISFVNECNEFPFEFSVFL